MQYTGEGQFNGEDLHGFPSIGPLAHNIQGLVMGCKAIMSSLSYELDPCTPPIPFSEEKYKKLEGKKLQFGYYISNGFFTPVPSSTRAVEDTIAALKRDGHDVELWDVSRHINKIVAKYLKTLSADGGETMNRMVRDDATDEAIGEIMLLLKIPTYLLKVIAAIIRPFSPSMALTLTNTEPIDSVIEWWDHVSGIYQIRRKIMDEWKSSGFDAIISPGMGVTPLPLYECKNVTGHIFYTAFYNLLDVPAGSLPVTTITKKDIESPYPLRDLWHRAAHNAMKGSEGLTVNIQVATLPYQDEMCLQIMQTVETAVRK